MHAVLTFSLPTTKKSPLPHLRGHLVLLSLSLSLSLSPSIGRRVFPCRFCDATHTHCVCLRARIRILINTHVCALSCARTRARRPLFVKSVRDIGLLSLRGQIVHLDSIASRPFSGGESGIMGLNHKSKVGVYNIRKNLSQNLDHYPKI